MSNKVINPITKKEINLHGATHLKLIKDLILDLDGLVIAEDNDVQTYIKKNHKEPIKKERQETIHIKGMIFNKDVLIEKELIKKDGTILEQKKFEMLKHHDANLKLLKEQHKNFDVNSFNIDVINNLAEKNIKALLDVVLAESFKVDRHKTIVSLINFIIENKLTSSETSLKEFINKQL
jgi:hypothetical protein